MNELRQNTAYIVRYGRFFEFFGFMGWGKLDRRVAPARKYLGEAALSLRSRRSGTKFAVSLLAKLLIKCRRLLRGFFWNTSLP